MLSEIEDAGGGLLSFAYDEAERLIQVRNQAGLVWTFERDFAGRVVRETDFDGLVIEYAYDKADRVIETCHADGSRSNYAYDKSGLVIAEHAYEPGTDEPSETTRFWYDSTGLVIGAENASALTTFERDAVGRVTAEIINGRRVESAFDCCGNRIERRIGGRLIAATYDPLGALQTLAIGDHAPLSLRYDARGREVSRMSSAGFVLDQAYDGVGQLLRQRSAPAAAGVAPFGMSDKSPRPGPAVDRQYGWDKAFAPVSIADRHWGNLAYGYDENGQILQTRFGDGAGERFRYDAALNTAGFGEGIVEHGRGPGVTPGVAGSGYRDPAMGGSPASRATAWLLCRR